MKNMADKDIEKKLRNRLMHHEEEPAQGAWAEIEKGLKPRVNYLPLALVLILGLLLIGTLTISYWEDLNPKSLAEEKHNKNSDNMVKPDSEKNSDLDIQTNKNIPADKGISNVNETSVLKSEEKNKNDKDLHSKDSSFLSRNRTATHGKVNKSPNKGAFNEKLIDDAADEVDPDIKSKEDIFLPDPQLLVSIRSEFKPSLPKIAHIIPVHAELATLSSTSSDKEKKKKKLSDKRLSLYFQGMPTLNFSRIEANANDNLLITKIKNIPTVSSERIGVRLESGLTYQVTSRFSLLLGLLYFDRQQRIDYVVSVVDSLTTQQSGNEIILEPNFTEESRSYDYHVRNIGTQVGFTYSIPSDKFETSIGSGVEFHRSIRSKADSDFEEPDFYVFYNLFYRVEYPKNKRFRVMMQPTFNYSFDISKSLSTPIIVKPYGFGLNFGFTIKL